VNHRLQHVTWWARQGLLTGGAVLGVVCILVTVAAALFGLRPLVVLSGSMSPTIDTGALAIAQEVKASTLEPGQIVAVPTGGGKRVTHRIVAVAMDGDDIAELELRGDANAASDADTYRVTHADRVLFDVPLVGYAIGWMVGPIGLFLLGLYAAFLLSVIVKRPPDRVPGANDLHLTASVMTLVVLGVAISQIVAPLRISPTLAAFTDQVPVSGATLGTATVGVPGSFACDKAKSTPTLTWVAVSPVTDYTVYTSASATPVGTTTGLSYELVAPGSGTLTAWVVANRRFASSTWTSVATASVTVDKSGKC
jgi:signal peptidase I